MSDLTPEQIKQAARILAHARRGRYAIDTLPVDCRPQSVNDGYLIQDSLDEELGYETGGWFCACTNVEVQDKLGLGEPYSARLFKQDIFESPTIFSAGHFPSTIVMECEFAFRLAVDIKPRTRPYDRGEVTDAVAADNGTDGAVAYGPGVEDWQTLDLPAMQVTLDINAYTIQRGTGSSVLGDPVMALVWLVNAVCQRGHELKAGDICNTGTTTSMQVAELGDQVTANFQGLGSVEVNLGA